MKALKFPASLNKALAWLKGRIYGNKLIVKGIKYIPIICTFLLSLHVFLLLMDVYEPITVGISAVLMVVLLVLLSIRFGFCKLHKAMIIYMGVLTLCICIQEYEGFGLLLRAVRIVMLVIGVVLLVLSALKCKNDECGE